jgi:hypothetical protein
LLPAKKSEKGKALATRTKKARNKIPEPTIV